MTFEEGFRLDKYRKIADINTRKNVYLVQHVETNRIFVRKEQKIYCREVYEYLKTWNNPHIPKIFECIEGEDTLILIEEYIQGESLSEHLKEKGVYSQEEVCRFVITICDVLERLHQLPQPIIHGDLKAENIIIQENGILKIINFNTVNDGENEKEFAKGIMGNQKYASPEQFGYSQSEVRADIYSLGVMMNYLLTNKYPDEYLFDYEREEKISLSYIIGKCIEISPDGRYENVTDLRQDLQALSGKTEKKGMWYLPFLPPRFSHRESVENDSWLNGVYLYFLVLLYHRFLRSRRHCNDRLLSLGKPFDLPVMVVTYSCLIRKLSRSAEASAIYAGKIFAMGGVLIMANYLSIFIGFYSSDDRRIILCETGQISWKP